MLPLSQSLPALVGASVLSLSLLSIGCGPDWSPPGPERTDTRSVDLDNSEEVRAELRMGAGELRVHGGATKLMEARFVYNRLRLRPEVTYHGGGAFRGHLLVAEPSGVRGATNRYEWNLAFNNDKPLDLEVKFGAGESHLDLGELSLRRVNVNMGVGELRMDLRGTPKNDYSVSIHGGVGEAIIYLPGNGVGIEAEAAGGIGGINTTGLEKRDGRYVNDAFGHAKTTVHLDIHGGIGNIQLIAE